MNIDCIITHDEYDKVSKLDYDKFSDYVSKLVKLCVEESLKALPSVITHLASQAAYLKELSDNFYKDNKDLDKHRPIMVKVIMQTEGENPGLDYKDILKKAAVTAREVIKQTDNLPSPHNPKDLKHFDSKLRNI